MSCFKLSFIVSFFVCLPACNTYVFPRYVEKEASYMLPASSSETKLDKALDPLIEQHPDETGLMLIEDNLEAFVIRALTAKEAGRSLDLQYYIWHSDLTGNLLAYELLRAADRGVRIRLLLDDLNAHDKDNLLAALEQHPNIEVRLFNPSFNRNGYVLRSLEMFFRGLSLNRRMHNKAWIADGKIAVVGGRNIGNEYFDAAPQTNFFDVDVLLTGKAVQETGLIFDIFWNSTAVIPLNSLVKIKDKHALYKLRQRIKRVDDNFQKETNVYLERIKNAPSIHKLFHGKRTVFWTNDAHVYSDPPEKVYDLNEEKWLINDFYAAWMNAGKQLRVISPYFVPGKTVVNSLGELHDKGVNIEILTNSLAATDVVMVHGGYAPYRIPLLKKGIQLYELMPFNKIKKKRLGSSGASLHTKAFMVDDSLSFVGSFNIDPRSARLNTEMGIFFKQSEITRELLTLFDEKIEADSSFRLFLEADKLYWLDGAKYPAKVWSHEPEASVFRRTMARIVRLLPIESQL